MKKILTIAVVGLGLVIGQASVFASDMYKYEVVKEISYSGDEYILKDEYGDSYLVEFYPCTGIWREVGNYVYSTSSPYSFDGFSDEVYFDNFEDSCRVYNVEKTSNDNSTELAATDILLRCGASTPEEAQSTIDDSLLAKKAYEACFTNLPDKTAVSFDIYTARQLECLGLQKTYTQKSTQALWCTSAKVIMESYQNSTLPIEPSQPVSAITATSTYFTDLTDSSFPEALKFCKDNNYVSGYADGSFKPKSLINRAEFLKMLLAEEADMNLSDCFPDVKNDWYAPYVCTAKNKGMVDGYEDGNFNPEKTINQAEAVKIISKATGLTFETKKDEVWYNPYYTFLNQHSGLNGLERTPGEFVKREDIAQILYNLLKK